MRSLSSGPSASEWNLSLGATAFVTGAGAVIMGALPLLVGFFSERLDLDWQEIGWLGVLGQVGMLAGTLLAYALIERRLFRVGVQMGALCALVCWTLAAFTDSYFLLLVWRALTAAGIGTAFAIGMYLLGGSVAPARAFSLMAGVQVACGALHSASLPWIHRQFGHVAAVASISIWFAVILVLALSGAKDSSPRFTWRTSAQVSAKQLSVHPAAMPLLASIVAFQTGAVVTWIYVERIAFAAGLPPGPVGLAIALGNLGGIPASILGIIASDRFGYFPLLTLATLAVISGELLMFSATTIAIYGAGQLVFNFGWMLGLSYYLGLLGHHDAGGRVIRLAPPALVIAGAIGPAAIALFTSSDNPVPVLALSLICCVGALVLAVGRMRHTFK